MEFSKSELNDKMVELIVRSLENKWNKKEAV